MASLFGALASAADAASGFHPEKAIRTAVVAARLARAVDLAPAQVSDAYYLALVRFLGCTAFAPEAARFGGGDDLSVGRVMALADPGEPARLLAGIVSGLGRGAPLGRRAVGMAALLSSPAAAADGHARSECEVGAALATRIRMPEAVVAGIADLFERWDGKGHPARKRAGEIAVLSRVVVAADVLELAFSRMGLAAATDLARRRSGGRFDPAVVTAFCDAAPEVVAGLSSGSVWDAFLDAEPEPRRRVTPAVVASYAEAFARAVDLKSVWTATHSHGVGVLAAAAGEAAGLDRDAVERLRVAGWLHDLGRVAVPNLVWDKPGPLNAAEWEQVRLHAYHTERLLDRSPALAPAALLAGAVHERCDGSGYPKRSRAAQLDVPSRLLAACDVYWALREDRPHRPARSAQEAAAVLSAEVGRGALDRTAVRNVLEAAGATPLRHEAPWPKGLTDREVEVLRLVVRGRTNKDVARALGISPRTVQHHVAHVYTKVGVSSRAAAALFAADHGLISPGDA